MVKANDMPWSGYSQGWLNHITHTPRFQTLESKQYVALLVELPGTLKRQ